MCPFPTLVMLGNHDAWTCLTAKRRKLEWGKGSWKNKEGKDPAAKVREQLEINADRNLAWNCKQLAGKPVNIVGGRPFSKVCSMCQQCLFSGCYSVFFPWNHVEVRTQFLHQIVVLELLTHSKTHIK